MADCADSCVCVEMDENKIRLPISPDKPSDVASPYAISSTVPEAAKNDDEEFKKIGQCHKEVLETSCKLITCGNESRENASIEQEVSRYQTCNKVTCNKVTALQGDKNGTDCTRSDNRCGVHEDLLFDIMLWLPVLSLLRFRSICRLWRSLIDCSTFIIQHYNHNSNKSCLLAHHVLSSYSEDYNSKFCLLNGNKYEVYNNLNYEKPWYSVNEITILNSCNGIVSLFNKESEDVALWNPATKQLRPLPKSSPFIRFDEKGLAIIEFGFGFDVKSNDYKAVKIFFCTQDKHDNMVQVYSLRTDSWRTIHKHDVLPFHYIDSDAATYNKGTCFWIGATCYDEYSHILISFDLNREVFETMLLPGEHDLNHCSYFHNALDILNDKLCYIKSVNLGPYDSYQLYFEIWMLDESGVKEPWKNICKSGPIGALEKGPPPVLRFAKNGEFLLLGHPDGIVSELYLTDFDAGEEEEYFEFQNPKPSPSKFVCYNKLQNPNPILSEFVWYDESLVSLKREDDGVREGFSKSDMK